MSTDEPLFDQAPGRRRGRMRRGLDAAVRAAIEEGSDLPTDGVAGLRILADRIDQLERALALRPKPYDHVPLAALLQRYGEDRDRTFQQAATDPITRALAAFMADEPGPSAPVGDLEGSPLPD